MTRFHDQNLSSEDLLEAIAQNSNNISPYIIRDLIYSLRPVIDDAWEDLKFPAQGINPAGSAAPPTIDTATVPGTLLFATNSDNHVAGVAQMPHAWKEGSTVSPHIHWTKTTADGSGLDVAWRFRYKLWSINSTASAYTSWLEHTLATGDLTTQEKQNISSFPDIDMTGYKVSTIIVWELMRDVSEDTYGSNARLIELDFHYLIDSQGSDNLYTKTY